VLCGVNEVMTIANEYMKDHIFELWKKYEFMIDRCSYATEAVDLSCDHWEEMFNRIVDKLYLKKYDQSQRQK